MLLTAWNLEFPWNGTSHCRPVVPGCAGCAILADQLTLFQPGGTDFAHLITTGTPGFADLPTALCCPFVPGKRYLKTKAGAKILESPWTKSLPFFT